MIADLKPYPEYKESRLPWLGQVPGHWEIRRLKSVAHIVMGQSPSSQTCSADPIGVPFLQGCAEFGAKVPKPRQFCSAAPKEAPADAVLLSVRAPVGRLNLADQKYGIGRGLCAIVPQQKTLATLYARYAIEAGTDGLMAFSTGSTYGAVSVGDVGVQPIPLPPPDEQAAIVRFLDWANGRLERAIRAKREVIALLNEQKQAIIHRAVTRGLDPAVPLKKSGIPWLGDIPEHWEVRRIKYLLREVDERSTTGSEPLLSMRMHHGLVLFAEHFSRPPQAATLVGFKIVRPGQFVVNRMQAGNGVIFASTLIGLVSPDYAVFDPIGDANVEFLGELFRSRKVRAKFRAESKGLGTGTSGFLRLYNDRFGAIHVALPPRVEQRNILTGVAGELSGVNTAISRLEREIELLSEYRTRLVADVVTGKLDVREVASRLPEEAPADITEDDTDLSVDSEAADEAAV
jgi:type I restriction enzyme S subunit